MNQKCYLFTGDRFRRAAWKANRETGRYILHTICAWVDTKWCKTAKVCAYRPKPLSLTEDIACGALQICCGCFSVLLLFYVHGKHLWSCRDGQLT